jgi:hypothetical protein
MIVNRKVFPEDVSAVWAYTPRDGDGRGGRLLEHARGDTGGVSLYAGGWLVDQGPRCDDRCKCGVCALVWISAVGCVWVGVYLYAAVYAGLGCDVHRRSNGDLNEFGGGISVASDAVAGFPATP